MRGILWILRVGAAGCFIGHGAFGIITKAAWVPYFGVVGIPESLAWKLMPWVGSLDILMGLLVLVRPMRILFLWGIAWCFWTALLRPFSGEPFWEALERAGNYGVPLALLSIYGFQGSLWRPLRSPDFNSLPKPQLDRLALCLRLTTATLLVGHAGCGFFAHKAMLSKQYLAIGLSGASVVTWVGAWEFGLAAVVLALPSAPVLLVGCLWKISSELLFPITGAPWWEFLERFGSYTAPLAAAILVARRVAMSETPTQTHVAPTPARPSQSF